MEWDNVTDTNSHQKETWMYPHRDTVEYTQPRVWAVHKKEGGYEVVFHMKNQERKTVPIDVTTMDDAKAMALVLFKME